jgi:hypothetical protein
MKSNLGPIGLGPVMLTGPGRRGELTCLFCKNMITFRQGNEVLEACCLSRQRVNPKECKIKHQEGQ